MTTAQAQYTEKIRLERMFIPEIKRTFNVVLRDFRVVVASKGVPPAATKYDSLWRVTLDRHYKRTQKAFMTFVKAPAGKKAKNEEEENKKDLMLLALATWREEESAVKSKLIGDATTSNMIDAVVIARTEADTVLTNRELSASATAVLKKKFEGRLKSISVTETQAASESTKYIGAEINNDLESFVDDLTGEYGDVKVEAYKIWSAIKDSRTRAAHAFANGQMKRINEPFEVGGQLLRFPGDRSLGATIENIANCRCIADYL